MACSRIQSKKLNVRSFVYKFHITLLNFTNLSCCYPWLSFSAIEHAARKNYLFPRKWYHSRNLYGNGQNFCFCKHSVGLFGDLRISPMVYEWRYVVLDRNPGWKVLLRLMSLIYSIFTPVILDLLEVKSYHIWSTAILQMLPMHAGHCTYILGFYAKANFSTM